VRRQHEAREEQRRKDDAERRQREAAQKAKEEAERKEKQVLLEKIEKTMKSKGKGVSINKEKLEVLDMQGLQQELVRQERELLESKLKGGS
jgi:hypothetical protein